MLRSAELRWFKAGQALDSEGVQAPRISAVSDCQPVGVKLREERLEIKAIVAASQPRSLEPGIQGRTEEWVRDHPSIEIRVSIKVLTSLQENGKRVGCG